MGIGELFSWWLDELAGMLPDAWRRRFERRQDILLLTLLGDEVRISRRDNGRLEELGKNDEIYLENPASVWRIAARRFFRRKIGVAGTVIIGFLVLIAIFAPYIAPYEPNQVLIGVEERFLLTLKQ